MAEAPEISQSQDRSPSRNKQVYDEIGELLRSGYALTPKDLKQIREKHGLPGGVGAITRSKWGNRDQEGMRVLSAGGKRIENHTGVKLRIDLFRAIPIITAASIDPSETDLEEVKRKLQEEADNKLELQLEKKSQST